MVELGEAGRYIVIGMVFLGGGRGVREDAFGFWGRGLEGLEAAVALGMGSSSSSIEDSSSTVWGRRLDLAVAREAVAVPTFLVVSWVADFGSGCFLLAGLTGISRPVDFFFPF